jgi:cytochrome b
VIDAPTRAFHWLFALSFAGAYLSADGERWRLLHVTLGYTLAGLLVFRLLYGLWGPRQVRLSLLVGKLRGAGPWLAQWATAAKERSLQPVNGRQGRCGGADPGSCVARHPDRLRHIQRLGR